MFGYSLWEIFVALGVLLAVFYFGKRRGRKSTFFFGKNSEANLQEQKRISEVVIKRLQGRVNDVFTSQNYFKGFRMAVYSRELLKSANSVFVYTLNDAGEQEYCIVQLDINLVQHGKEIRLFIGRQRDEQFFNLKNLELALARASSELGQFSNKNAPPLSLVNAA